MAEQPRTPGAVFLSYAREDTDAARRIADALRSQGIEVWFDQSELRGGEAWDAKIKKQIRECALFLAVVSAHTQERTEGYFRREWKMAVERTHDMAAGVAFVVPVVIDDTAEAQAVAPDEFMRVQWTRLPGALPTPEFVAQVKSLLGGSRRRPSLAPMDAALTAAPMRTRPPMTPLPVGAGAPKPAAPVVAPAPVKKSGRRTWIWVVLLLVIGAAGAAVMILQQPEPPAEPPRSVAVRKPAPPAPAPAAPVAPAIIDKSIAVLAFTNLSDDKANEYFSDGISEELLNVLAKVPGLKVTARTSSFHFKGKDTAIKEIAQQLGVAYVVEGSVRKSGTTVRITAQLIKAADGFHVWSDNFTRDLKDIFAVQDEIAGLIAKTLQLKIGVVPATVAVKPQAFELYLQGRQAWNLRTTEGFARAETLLAQALELEPGFARAHAALADVWTIRAITEGVISSFGQRNAPVFSRIVSEIEKALALEPDSSEAHASLGFVRLLQWNLNEAERELRRAVALNPNYATGHHWLGGCLLQLGWIDESLVERNRAAELDPFSFRILDNYGGNLLAAGRYAEALTMLDRSLALQPKSSQTLGNKARALLRLGRRDEAIVIARELAGSQRAELLAAAGLKAEAEAALAEAKGWSRYHLLTAMGRYDEAIGGLRAEDVPITGVGNWLLDQGLDPFRHDPRLLKLLAALDLTEAHARAQAWRQAHPPKKAK